VPFDLALADLITPYLLRGDSFGSWHAVLSVIYVDDHSLTIDDTGIVVRGVARFSGSVHPFVNPSNMSFGVNPENTEGHPANDPGRRDPWIDVRDAHIDFELSAPRVASQKVSSAVTAIGANAGFAQSAAVLTAYDSNPSDAPPSDYPSTEFVLDMVLTTVVLRPPFLHPARLEPSGQLVDDTTKTSVTFTLPRIKVRLFQGSSATDPLAAQLLSLGASGLDDPGDIGVAELVTMDPPYAFIGTSHVVGFGFRSAVLDLSDGSTPPDVLSQFGYDESWTGLYLPEVRFFVAPHGATGLAVDAGARNLLIGFSGSSAGVTGDFDLEVLDQGSGKLHLRARFYDDAGGYLPLTTSDDTTASVALPEKSRVVVDVDGGLTPYNVTAQFDTDAPQTGRVFDVDLSSTATKTIKVNAADASATPAKATLTITANRRSSSASAPAGSSSTAAAPAAEVSTTSVTQGGKTVEAPRLRLVSETPSSATIALDADPPPSAHWTVDGADRGTSTTLTVDLSQGASVNVQGEITGSTPVSEFTAFYHFDHPTPSADQGRAEALNPDNTHTTPAADTALTSQWRAQIPSQCGVSSNFGDSTVASALGPVLAALPAGTAITIKGFSSFETGGGNALQYNTALAQRRALGLEAIIASLAAGKNFETSSTPPSADMSNWPAQGDPNRSCFWRATASWAPQALAGTITIGTVSRGTAKPTTPQPVPDNPTAATPPAKPSWFKQMGAKVRIVRNQFVACEIFGKFDIQTASERQLAAGGVSNANMPALRRLGSNPADGIIDVRIVIQIDDATDIVTVTGYFGADPADRDGLMMTGALPNEPLATPTVGRNVLGMAIVFMPLLSSASNSVANDGGLAEIGMTAAALALPLTLAGLGWITVERIIWYGGELLVQVRPEGTQVAILLDLETAFSADVKIGSLKLLSIKREGPIAVRYKAVGLLLGNPPGQPVFQFRPVFDSSKGYSIDLSKPGSLEVAEPLGKILRVLGARMARNNPLMLEIDLGFAVDLGVISIERARVRMKLDPPGTPELTAFGAGVDIPGALRGKGYLELNEVEIKGQLDLTIVPVQVRIAAGVGVAHIPASAGGPATAVVVTLSVEFPVAIPLAASGLGIYGFLGLFAMDYARNESSIPAGNLTPALAWLKATGGDPTKIAFWKPTVNTWAFGVGAVLGTMGSSVIFNLKGVILLELPGPRLLLMMKAKLLAAMPSLGGNAEGTFLAVIDLDFGRGTLTIGLAIDFSVDPLFVIKIPSEAFFNFNNTNDWHMYLGQYKNQVQAKVLQVFDASGYLMLSGNGISGITHLPAVTGFSIAAGLHVSITWGGGPLYVQVAAGFDAIVGFTPFRMAGYLYMRGSLHLFIIDIGAYAELTADVGEDNTGAKIARLEGDICGEVDFFFFSISGCISFSLGASSVPIPDPPPLAKGVKLVSRSPALVVGTGVDKPIDSGIGDGIEGQTQPSSLPVVPIDAIPVLMLAMPPLQAPGLKFAGGTLGGTPEAPADGWVERGDVWFKYTVQTVELIGSVTAGNQPATWWKSKAGAQALEAQLALLSWVPEATPKAVGSSKYLDETVKEQWGTVCWPAAPAAPVFWTFLAQVLGPSAVGWRLEGKAWPDPPQSVRSMPPDLNLKVTERWRCGDPVIDRLRGIVPAQVEGKSVQCAIGPITHLPDVFTTHVLARAADRASAVVATPTAEGPVAALRGFDRTEAVVANEALTISDAVGRFRLGQPVGRATLMRLAPMGADLATIVGRGTCFARALASPVFDDGTPIAFGDPAREKAVREGWAQHKFRPGPLDDAVVFATGPFRYARLFLWVPIAWLEMKTIVVAATDANDQVISQHIVSVTDKIPPVGFPPSWNDPAGPWHGDVELVSEMLALEPQHVGVFVQLEATQGADRIQVGLSPASRSARRKVTSRPFYVAALEVQRSGEALRYDYDRTEQTTKQGVLEQALGLDSADNALLVADTVYQVRLTWDASRQRRTDGGGVKDEKSVAATAQSFWFRTDKNPPARLDPWVLVALPGEGEAHYFFTEPIRIVFATNNLERIFDAYGKKLQARLKPASFRPVPSTPTVPHPFPLDKSTLKPVKAAVLSPWEGAVSKALDGTCVPVNGERVRHTMATIPIPLDPDTDYVLDIEMLDKTAAVGSVGQRLWRGSFSTGGFRTLPDFASEFQSTRVSHRGVHSDNQGKLQAIGTTFAARDPQGSEFDDALVAAGLEPRQVTRTNGVVIFWDATSPVPQPAAVLVDASEPMWRSRPLPTELTDSGPASAKRYELQARPWLDLVVQPGGDAIVEHIVRSPGGERALVTLKANARGQRIRLALRRIAHPEPYLDGSGATDQLSTVLDLTVDHAPWEEID
jgi:hypothetical protein